MIIFNGADNSKRFEPATVGVKKMSFLDQISAPPYPWTMYIGYFVIPEVKRTSVMEGNLINRYMMSVKKFRTNCRKSAFLLPVRTFAVAVAMCSHQRF